MKTSFVSKILLVFAMAFYSNGNAQFFKKLAKKAEQAAERTVERRVETETTKKTDQALDSILETGSGGQKAPKSPENTGSGNQGNTGNGNQDAPSPETSETSGPKNIRVYSKFDYVPGDKPMFFDDFVNDFVGDFPSKWNTNGGGEVVTLGDSPEKWLELISGYSLYYIPDVPQLPEEYTIEFDLMTVGTDNKTSSNAILRIDLSDDDKFKDGSNFVHARISPCEYTPIGITMSNRINNKREIYSVVKADLRDEFEGRPHISIAVNKQRFRLWVNEEKHIDIPRIVPTGAVLNTLKFHANGFKDGKERLFITNLKVAEGGVDLRRKLISEGKVSTNGILFDVGSANIQPQSMGIIRQISQVLKQETSIGLKIVGHTDADGSDGNNQTLSKNRAEAVKNALVSVYGISSDRLISEGKGESEPVGDNSTAEGKAQNRRVEFIKM
ncbi:OmpA family protein [Flagellimonas eckloniae]|uniref:Membrane protein n=1 Tax=Flagellimonas eckloniae TaxID=346185 RepID=A0A0Q0XJU0_9FLAO|nr:OmpA family protein [Allomuricauda eckloniae]KQC31165.1 membrane protein [Allomuricauda eckloniae]